MEYLIVLGNGMSPNKPLNECETNVRFCFVQYIKAVVYKKLFKFIGCMDIRDVPIGSFFNVLQCMFI